MSKEQCTKIIREKLPHLQELSFGCVVRTDKLSRYTIHEPLNIIGGVIYESLWGCDMKHGKITEILGKPISINDWLGLLGEDYATDGKGYVIYKGGAIWGYQWSDKDEKIQFDLSKPFNSQSEAFYEWLLENIT